MRCSFMPCFSRPHLALSFSQLPKFIRNCQTTDHFLHRNKNPTLTRKLNSSVQNPTLKRKLNSSVISYYSSSTMDRPPPGYRPNVGICLINSANKVFVASRLDVPGAWQMPQGGVDDGEEPRAAAIRELYEETGVQSADILAEVPHWLSYEFPPAVKEKVDRLWGGDWKGQAQKWFLFRFTGDEKEINLSGNGTEAAEFSEWMWLPPEQVIEQAVDFKRPVYEKVFSFFSSQLGSPVAG